ncbi:MAG: DNA polymerase I, partial [Bacteroidetes bacterium]
MVGISFCFRKAEAYYVPIPAYKSEALKIVQEFKQVLENQAIGKIGQNLKYDIMVLQSYEIKVKGKFFDTMLAHYLLEPDQRHNMDSLSENYLNYSPISIEELIGKKGKNQLNMRQIAVSEVAKYACEDADVTWQLKEVFEAKIKETKIEKLFEDVEIPLLEVLAQVERNGVKIDESALKIFSKELETDLGVIEQEIYLLAGQMFNISSPKQMGEILFEKLKIGDKTDKKLKKTKTGQYSTGEEVLADLEEEHEIVRKILEFRELQKLKSTYVDSFPELVSPKDGLIHTSYNQAVAA